MKETFLYDYINTFVKELNDQDILIFEKMFAEDNKIVVNKQLNPLLNALNKNNKKQFISIYKEANRLGIASPGILSMIINARIQYIEFKQKSANIEFSLTQNRILNKTRMKSTSTQKSLLRVIEKANNELIIFGYDISYPDNPAFLLLKKKVAEGSLKLIIIAHSTFLPRFKYHWGMSSLKNVYAYTVQLQHKNHNMHAKIAFADKNIALITSANLTFQGMKKNIEIGITVEGEKVKELYADIQNIIKSHRTILIDWDDIEASISR